MSGELERRTEVRAKELAERYAGFVDVEALTTEEKVLSLISLIPMAIQVVEEARDTIERLNAEVARLSAGSGPSAPARPSSG